MLAMIGMPPATEASNAIERPSSRARSNSSGPCSASSALLAVTTSLPLSSSRSMIVRSGSRPPMRRATTLISGLLITSSTRSVSTPFGRSQSRAFFRSRTTAFSSHSVRPACRAVRSPWSSSSLHALPDRAQTDDRDLGFFHRIRMMATLVFSTADSDAGTMTTSTCPTPAHGPQRLVQLAPRGERILDIEPQDLALRIERDKRRGNFSLPTWANALPSASSRVGKVGSCLFERRACVVCRLIDGNADDSHALFAERSRRRRVPGRPAASATSGDRPSKTRPPSPSRRTSFDSSVCRAAQLVERDCRHRVAHLHSAKCFVLFGEHHRRNHRPGLWLPDRAGPTMGDSAGLGALIRAAAVRAPLEQPTCRAQQAERQQQRDIHMASSS